MHMLKRKGAAAPTGNAAQPRLAWLTSRCALVRQGFAGREAEQIANYPLLAAFVAMSPSSEETQNLTALINKALKRPSLDASLKDLLGMHALNTAIVLLTDIIKGTDMHGITIAERDVFFASRS
jgi:hypothetical protein